MSFIAPFRLAVVAALTSAMVGCVTAPVAVLRGPGLKHAESERVSSPPDSLVAPQFVAVEAPAPSPLQMVSLQEEMEVQTATSLEAQIRYVAAEGLPDLELQALSSNPKLWRLSQEVAAAEAKADYVGHLPDPSIGVNVFAHPIETAAGSQTANLTVRQMFPWLHRLDAESQKACLEAAALQQLYEFERLKVIGDLRSQWARLYTVQREYEANQASQQLLRSLIDVANSRVATGKASQGDVLLATLEFSRVEEKLLHLQQRMVSIKAALNRLAGREASTPLEPPASLQLMVPAGSHDMFRDLAWENQPEIIAGQIRAEASSWGLEIARLQRRPDLSLSASWYAIDDDRPLTGIVEVGADAWSIGAQVSIPMWHRKYDAIQREADWKHAASQASIQALYQQYDALVRDLWQQVQTSADTARLYEDTVLPQAKQVLEADQLSYTNGGVDFERVVRDTRNLLTLEVAYHQARGRAFIALARLQQATGTDLTVPAESE